MRCVFVRSRFRASVRSSSRRLAVRGARARAAHLGGSRDARRTTDASSRRASNSRRRARGFVRRCVRVAFSSVSVANRTESNRNRIEIEITIDRMMRGDASRLAGCATRRRARPFARVSLTLCVRVFVRRRSHRERRAGARRERLGRVQHQRVDVSRDGGRVRAMSRAAEHRTVSRAGESHGCTCDRVSIPRGRVRRAARGDQGV